MSDLDYDFLNPGGGPVPSPVINPDKWPADEGIQANRGLAALNQRRKERGVGPLKLDAKLTAAARVLAIPLGAGKAQPHDGFPKRVRDAGWPVQQCKIRNAGFGNVSEGCSEGASTPEECVLILDDSSDPREPHRRDFEDPAFTHVGIAYAKNTGGELSRFGGYVAVVDYGALCDPLPTPTPKPPVDELATIRKALLDAHNEIRKGKGLGLLREHPKLAEASQWQSNDCAKRGRLSHTSSDGRSPFRRMSDFGYNYTWAAENIAWNQQTVAQVMQTWMNSPGHRVNILGRNYTDAGFGYVKDAHGGIWWTADFGATASKSARRSIDGQEPYEIYHADFSASAFRPLAE